ncbi:MAG: formate--tetrahydrofolate ligase [Actinomycetia bacterium]|nr:formate--tetrahydrofolate ligase [Actinomycetes bacterium]
MSMPSDLEIAQQAKPRLIEEIAASAGIERDRLEPYGRHVAKLLPAADAAPERRRGRYVLVTAITPTPLGEGKTATSVSLAQGMARTGRSAMLTLRQPSLGPTFGIKGGAAGGGYSQVIPMDKLNLHLTGDFHAVTAAHNMLAALLDNHLHHGNALDIDERSITWRRVLDINDRSLRHVVIGLGERQDGVTRQSGFDITSASEIMVILSLATDLADLKARLARIVVASSRDGAPVTAADLKADGALAALLADAIHPNLMQTLEGVPALIHTGPFGNIATGNSSILADYAALEHADYVITEAGFGADMGAERFVNVKCRVSGLTPDAAVLVVTVRALKAHSGRHRIVPGKPLPEELLAENPEDVRAGAPNLLKHLEIQRGFGISPVVAINAFPTDHPSEHAVIREIAEQAGARVAVHEGVARGGDGATELADAVAEACEQPHELVPTYAPEDSLTDKLDAVARKVYGADGLEIAPAAARQLARCEEQGYGDLPVVIAKTHLSLTADPTRKGAPTGWRLPVREVRLAAGAGYVYAICGTMRTMPGLSASPAAERIGLDADGAVHGLF